MSRKNKLWVLRRRFWTEITSQQFNQRLESLSATKVLVHEINEFIICSPRELERETRTTFVSHQRQIKSFLLQSKHVGKLKAAQMKISSSSETNRNVSHCQLCGCLAGSLGAKVKYLTFTWLFERRRILKISLRFCVRIEKSDGGWIRKTFSLGSLFNTI